MQMLKTFAMGGVHPPQEKRSSDQSIIYGNIPEQLWIPVNQHIGKPCEVVVERRAVVKRGDILAKSTGYVSSNVHAPVDGIVDKIIRFPQLGGQSGDCILLKPSEPGRSYKEIIESENTTDIDIDSMTPKLIRSKIEEAGIVGMGGAGFPTHVKLSPPADKVIDTLIINGAECEPYITSDHRVMLEKSDELFLGIQVLQKMFNGVPVYIGVEVNKPDAIRLLERKSKNYNNIFISPLKVKYPQGGEKQLIKAILDREVPSKNLPMDVGVVVQNVSTVIAIHDAVYYNRPLTGRVVTIAGNLVHHPGNIMLPVGTPVSTIIKDFEIDSDRVRMFISGGPMMGKTSFSFESPITKTTSALLFFDESNFVNRVENPCIRCGSCITVCPMGLTPVTYTDMIRANKMDKSAKEAILDCIECGSCSYNCPANRKLVHWMRLGKNMIRREN
ncbi:MAG: electron transport complex subunit RsxC [Calditrichaceae bacterium]